MFRRLRETGPVVLVPLAWTFVAAAHVGRVSLRTLLIAHLVMAVLLAAFAVLSWRDMAAGALRTWRRIVVVGLGATLAGAAGLAATPTTPALLWAAVLGWMALPAAGLLDTGRRVEAAGSVYLAGGALSAGGAVAYALAPLAASRALTLAGLTLVGVGQTAGIVAAVAAD